MLSFDDTLGLSPQVTARCVRFKETGELSPMELARVCIPCVGLFAFTVIACTRKSASSEVRGVDAHPAAVFDPSHLLAPSVDEMTYAKLKALAVSFHEKQAKSGGATLSEFLSQLPLEFRSYRLVAYESRSSQKFEYSVDKAQFRYVLTGPSGNFALAFVDSGETEGPSSFEFFEFRAATNDYAFGEVSFPTTPGAAIEFKDGGYGSDPSGRVTAALLPVPTSCRGCHTVDFRPIWEAYPFWPGFFGAMASRVGFFSDTWDGFRSKTIKVSEKAIFEKWASKPTPASVKIFAGVSNDAQALASVLDEFSHNLTRTTQFRLHTALAKAVPNWESRKLAFFKGALGCREPWKSLPELEGKSGLSEKREQLLKNLDAEAKFNFKIVSRFALRAQDFAIEKRGMNPVDQYDGTRTQSALAVTAWQTMLDALDVRLDLGMYLNNFNRKSLLLETPTYLDMHMNFLRTFYPGEQALKLEAVLAAKGLVLSKYMSP